ncbi:hypothetical protein HMPREF3213_02661 [Heyndrickxia coagulans]|uniref:Uncharacterized protein n=1 Tax=Heyndrickxia coagulans TaxID=1398 RepID=A0A133KJ19_HEYCO|nr:hypothetical protein HMPREF3213_02661 [Heyndrickxia coagulans]
MPCCSHFISKAGKNHFFPLSGPISLSLYSRLSRANTQMICNSFLSVKL